MNLKVVAKAIIAFLGSGAVTAAVAAVPGFLRCNCGARDHWVDRFDHILGPQRLADRSCRGLS